MWTSQATLVCAAGGLVFAAVMIVLALALCRVAASADLMNERYLEYNRNRNFEGGNDGREDLS